MKNMVTVAGVAIALGLTACSGETSAQVEGVDAEADTSRNWVEVVSRTEEGGFKMGKPDAPIQLVEFASLTCGHCATFAEASFGPLTEDYVAQGLVSFEIRNFVRDPLDLSAALLSRCNGAEPFFQLTERMFANQNGMIEEIQGGDQARIQAAATPQGLQSGEAFVVMAEEAGLVDFVGGMGIPAERARQCLTDPTARQELEQIRNQAASQYNIPGTPAFLINGDLAQNVTTWEQVEARLQQMLE